MADPSTVFEITDYKSFPEPTFVGAVGMVFGRISNGLTTSFFSQMVYPFQLDANGYPSIDVSFALNAIQYSVASEVLIAVQYLQGHGWFESEVEFFISVKYSLEQLHTRGWTSESVGIVFYLEDVIEELQAEGKEFSVEWYYAKVAQLYFRDGDVPDVAMTIGILLAQLWWKVDLGDVTELGFASSEGLQKANSARKNSIKAQSEAKNRVLAEYFFEAAAEFGSETMRRDSNAALAIYEIALRKRPKELLIKSSGEIIGVDAIRKRISELRKLKIVG